MASPTPTIIISAVDKTRAAVDSAKRNLAGVQGAATNLAGVMGRLAALPGLGALTAGLSGAGFVALVKGANDAIDALNDVKDATGASIENISALEDVARRTGGGLDVVETSLVKLNQALNSADPDSKQASILKAIGVSAEELRRIDPAEALLKVATALNGYADDGNKARAAQDLLGKSWKELAPFLKDLAEAGKLNATVTTEQAEKAEKFNKQLFAMQTNISNLGRSMAMEMVPALSAIAEKLSLAADKGDLLRQSWLELSKLSAAAGAKIFGGIPGMAFDRAAEQLFQEPGSRDTGIRRIGAAPAAPDKPKPSLPELPEKPKKTAKPRAHKEYDAELEMSRRAAEAYADALGKITDAQADASESALTLTPSQKALRDLMADPVWQTMPDPWKQTAIAQAEAAVSAERAAAERKRLKDLLADTPTAQLDAMRDSMQFLARAFEEGRIGAEQFVEAASKVGALDAGLKEQADEIDQFWVGAARNIQSTIADALTDGFRDGGKNIIDDFGRLITQLAAQAVAADLARKLFGADFASGKSNDIGGLAGDALGWIAGLFKSADGNAFTGAGPVAAFASGGAFGRGEVLTHPTLFRFAAGGAFRAGVAGEAGPEGALPLTRMANGKLGVHAMGAGQGGHTFVANITVPPGTPAAQQASLAQQSRAAMAAFERMRRYG